MRLQIANRLCRLCLSAILGSPQVLKNWEHPGPKRMHAFRFLPDADELGSPLNGSYDLLLVALSVLIAALAAYAALGLAGRVRAAETAPERRLWLGSGSLAMGVGIWAMHFVGMLAFRLPVSATYDLTITVVSLAPAILASLVALRFFSREQSDVWAVLLCGGLMAAGIGAMHYTGMAAMRLPAAMYYDPLLFTVSLVVAWTLASFALGVSRNVTELGGRTVDYGHKLSAAGLMGLAVAGMHYTGMSAARFFVIDGASPPVGAIEPTVLGAMVTLASVIILGLAMSVAIVERRLQAATRSAQVSRSRMLQAIEIISEGFALYDADDRLVLCNRKYRELLSGVKDYGLEGETFESIVRRLAESGVIPEAQGCADQWVAARVLRHQQPPGPYVQRRSGDVWMQINEYKTAEGETVAIYSDITELKRAEHGLAQALENLQETQSHLVQSEKMAALGKLTAGIAHEINNPVGIVSSSADNSARCVQRIMEVLTSGVSLEEIRADRRFQQALTVVGENAQVIVRASERIAKIVHSLNTFAQPDDQNYRGASLEDCVDSTLALLQHVFREGVSLVKRFGGTPQVLCNPGELNQVFLTVISNAAQAIEGDGEVVISTTQEGDFVCVEIADTGRGMSPEQVDGLFDLGFKTTGSRIGVGMDLVNAYAIIERHRGRISVSSELGQGTRFRIELPMGVRP